MQSKVTDREECFFCGGVATQTHHLIFGNGRREFADRNGLFVPICDRCHTASEHICDRIHDNSKAEQLSKMLGQAIYERDKVECGMATEDARTRFIQECGMSFL